VTQQRDVLLASARDWLGTSLVAVLEPSGFRLDQVATGADLLERAPIAEPDIIMLDEALSDVPVPELCRRLSPTIETGTPILLYSTGDWASSDRQTAFDAGAWDHIEEPIRPGQLISKLSRLSRLRRLLDESRRVAGAGTAGTETLSGFVRMVTVFRSIARRADSEVGCVVLGPTRVATTPGDEEPLRAEMRSLVGRQTRGSDVCAWVGPAEFAVLLYGAGIDGLGAFVGRLVRERAGAGGGRRERSLSAGLVSLSPGPDSRTAGPGVLRILAPLEAAHDALQRAREAGGGVRVAVDA